MQDEKLRRVYELVEQQNFSQARYTLCSLDSESLFLPEVEELADRLVNYADIERLLPNEGFPDTPRELKEYLFDHYSLNGKILYKLTKLNVTDTQLFPAFPTTCVKQPEYIRVVFVDEMKRLFAPPNSTACSYAWDEPKVSYQNGVLYISQYSKYYGEDKSTEDVHSAFYRIKGHFFLHKTAMFF